MNKYGPSIETLIEIRDDQEDCDECGSGGIENWCDTHRALMYRYEAKCEAGNRRLRRAQEEYERGD